MKTHSVSYLAALFISLFGSSVCAQAQFIQPLPATAVTADSAYAGLLHSLEGDSAYLNVVPVKMNNLWHFQSDSGQLSFSLPGMQQSIEASVTVPKNYSATHYEWTGDILDAGGDVIGYANFVQKGSKKFGSINLRERRFIIRDLNLHDGDDQVLLEIDHTAWHSEKCGTQNLGPIGPTGGPPPPVDPCEATLRILFLYTDAVANLENYDPEQKVYGAVAAINEAFAKSGIPNVEVSAEIAAIELLEGFEEQSYGGNALDELGESSEVSLLRAQHNADLVVLLQAVDMLAYNDGDVDIAGIATTNDVSNAGDEPNPERVYSAIEAKASFGTFVHEVGHLLGCRHEYEDDPHSFANANRFCILPNNFGCNQYKSTVMYSYITGYRVLRFSNPDPSGSYQGYITGSTEHDNARMISWTACAISQYGEQLEGGEVSTFNVFISGPANVYQGEGSFYYDSYYQGCTNGGVDYQWEISWDYQNTFEHVSFGQDMTLEGGDVHPYMPFGYIRLTAVCSEGSQTVSKIFELKKTGAPIT